MLVFADCIFVKDIKGAAERPDIRQSQHLCQFKRSSYHCDFTQMTIINVATLIYLFFLKLFAAAAAAEKPVKEI